MKSQSSKQFERLPEEAKRRLIVLTDISDLEPDDKESMVRLMLYSNEFDVEGLIATSSIWFVVNHQQIAPEKIEQIVRAYGKVRPNLLKHAPCYPTAEYLLSLVKTGNENDMVAVGADKDTEGSELIISAVDKDDPRPVWITVWGGISTLAQAFWKVKNNRSAEAVARFVSKLRVYDLSGQDDAGAWICHTFPDIFYIRNVLQFRGMSGRQNKPHLWQDSRGGNEELVSPVWFDQNVRTGHGALGAEYPQAACIYEGDTPTYLYLIPNGLSDPECPHHGSWGGRFTREKRKNVRTLNSPIDYEKNYDDYWMYADEADEWKYNGRMYHNIYSPLFRWREAFQNDFAARMDWCVKESNEANHNPVAVINGDATKMVLHRKAKAGESIMLDASGSFDPDRNTLSYQWWTYQEAGTYNGQVDIVDALCPRAEVQIPADAAGREIHIVLTLCDNGDPNLYSYRRIVIEAE